VATLSTLLLCHDCSPPRFLSINTGEESRQKKGRKRGKKGRTSGIEKKKNKNREQNRGREKKKR
jgi:hypothetical protein